MTSLGSSARTGLLLCDEIRCTGQISAVTKKVGPDKNQSFLDHNGSVFYIKWTAVHQCESLSTINSSLSVTWNTTADHNFEIGDTIHISSAGLSLTINNIPISELSGTHVITNNPSATSFSYEVNTAANATSTSSAGTPFVRCDRFKSIDMATDASDWTSGTTLPIPLHTNVIETFFS